MMQNVVFVSAVRTPFGKLGGSLANVSAVNLGKVVIRASLKRSEISSKNVNEVFMGNVVQAGNGQNPARQAALGAGLPYSVPATTINDVCGSGMQAIRMAASQIQLGNADVIVAGGMESMSQAPFLIPKGRFGYKYGNGTIIDSLYNDGIEDAYGHYAMGVTAENLLAKYPFSRQAMDNFALTSHQKARHAEQNHLFADEIVSVDVKGKKGNYTVTRDEPIRDTSLEKMAKLSGAFKDGGQITAGNSSGLNDGAAAVVMTSERYAQEHDLNILGYWSDSTIVGVDPAIMGIGPSVATKKLFDKHGISQDDIDLFEINEAFAIQVLVAMDHLDIDPNKVNVNGGAIALGHPLGASGARIIVTLLHEMKRQNLHTGVATLCIGGGMGASTLITE